MTYNHHRPVTASAADDVQNDHRIRVQHPVHRFLVDPGVAGVQRVVLTAPRPEAIGDAHEDRLVDRIQDGRHRWRTAPTFSWDPRGWLSVRALNSDIHGVWTFEALQGQIAADNYGSWLVQEAPPAVPIPAALPLIASALIGFGFVGIRRRKAQAT